MMQMSKIENEIRLITNPSGNQEERIVAKNCSPSSRSTALTIRKDNEQSSNKSTTTKGEPLMNVIPAYSWFKNQPDPSKCISE